MQKIKIAEYDNRMLRLIEYSVEKGIYPSLKDCMEDMGVFVQAYYNVKAGKHSFRANQIDHLLKKTGANANWLFGTSNQMFTNKKEASAIEIMKEYIMSLKEK